jgi:DNA-binding transcriptional LysR family regulator
VCAVLPATHRLADRAELTLPELAGDPWVLTPRASWPPWHEQYDRDFAAAGFTPSVVQRAATVPNLLGLVAAGVGVTRLAASARTLRDTGVAFVPITGARAETVAAWRTLSPAAERLLGLLTAMSETTDLTAAG